MKHIFKIVILIIFFQPCFSQQNIAKKIDLLNAPPELKNSLDKFINILNGEFVDDLKTLYQRDERRPMIEIPDDYPAPIKEKRRDDSKFEIQRVYVLKEKLILVVYGVVGGEVRHDSPTALWIENGNSWFLAKYGFSMSDTLRDLPLEVNRSSQAPTK